MARLATVSKLWAESYNMRLSAEQQRLKALVAEASLGPSSAAPRQPLLNLLPSHLPPSPTPSIPGQGFWQPFVGEGQAGLALPGFVGCWQPDGLPVVMFSLLPPGNVHVGGFNFGSNQCFQVYCTSRLKSGSLGFFVKFAVGKPQDMPQLLGLLLVLLQDRLPRLLEEHRQQSGRVATGAFVVLQCTLSFGSTCSMWAPLAPLLVEMRYEDSGHKRIVISCANKIEFLESNSSLEAVDLEVHAPSWGP